VTTSVTHSTPEIIRYIETSGENDHIDAKGPMKWDGNSASASLAKDIVAFANSRDGGVIVIGKSEFKPGEFDMTGLTEEQANSFETTKVANWVNSRFSPSARLVCHIQQHNGKKFVVITVSEFDDIPILCTKSFPDPANPKKHLLKDRTIYVRTANAESAPLGTVEELRTLIGLATSKRGNEMLSMFESMLRGRPLVRVASDEEQFEEELTQIQSGLAGVLKDTLAAGGWNLIVYPSIYRSDRWEDNEELESIIQRRSVRIRDEFPPLHRGTHRREWGICNDTYRDIWTLASSGLFAYWKPYWENERTFKNPYQGEPNVEPGKWLDFQPNVYNIIEMFMFMVRFVEEFEPGEEFSFRLRADSLAGRKLVSTNPRIHVSHGPPEPCRANVFEKRKQLTVEAFRTDWKRMCAATLKDFFEFFPSERIQVETMLNWVEKFESRDF
jgi:schlafen family protein